MRLVSFSLVVGFLKVTHGFRDEFEEIKLNYSYCQAPTPNPNRYKPLSRGKLISVHLVARHGDRTPTSFLPLGYEKDPWNCGPVSSKIINGDRTMVKGKVSYNQDLCTPEGYCTRNQMNKIIWPGNCTSGQLTPKGMTMLYNLGKSLKEIYIDQLHFMSSCWKESQQNIFVRASDFQRTQQSAMSVISGLFHSSLNEESTLNIFSFPLEIETVYSNYKTCPKIQKIESEIKNSKDYQSHLNEVKPLRNKFDSILEGTKIGYTKDSVTYYVDVFQPRTCHGFPTVCKLGQERSNKNCINKHMIQKMMQFGNREYELYYRDHPEALPVAARLRVGEVLLEMKRNLLAAIEKESGKVVLKRDTTSENSGFNLGSKKFIYFSAHDTTIAPILGAFQSYQVNWPPYASSFLTELWQVPSHSPDILNHFKLRFIYNGEPVRTPWCPSGSCFISKFLNHLDFKLGIVGGFENYGIFTKSSQENGHTENHPPPVWDMLQECWSDL